MTTGDHAENDPAGQPVSQTGQQPQDRLLGQPQGGEPGLDIYGVPVQDRPAKGRVYQGMIASSICAVISAGLAVAAFKSPKAYYVPPWQLWLGAGTGILAGLLGQATLERAKKKQQLGIASRSILQTAKIVGFIGFITMMVILAGPLGEP